MKLSDIMSGARLEVFAEIAFVIALVAAAGILFYTFTRRNRAVFDRARLIPLAEDGALPESPPTDTEEKQS